MMHFTLAGYSSSSGEGTEHAPEVHRSVLSSGKQFERFGQDWQGIVKFILSQCICLLAAKLSLTFNLSTSTV